MSIINVFGNQGSISIDFAYEKSEENKFDESIAVFIRAIPAIKDANYQNFNNQAKEIKLDLNKKITFALGTDEIFDLYALCQLGLINSEVKIIREKKLLTFRLVENSKKQNKFNNQQPQQQYDNPLQNVIILASFKSGDATASIPINYHSFRIQYMKAIDYLFDLRLKEQILTRAKLNRQQNFSQPDFNQQGFNQMPQQFVNGFVADANPFQK